MSMLDMLEKEINKLNLFEGNIPVILKYLADSIPSRTIPYRMKLALAVSEVMLYTSQFRINIQHWNGSIIPINSIMFCIAKSGAAKDSSLKAVRKCFNNAYVMLNARRTIHAVQRAQKEAKEDGKDCCDQYVVYKQYLKTPNPLFVAISTPEGFIQHLNDLDEDTIGAGYTFSGEFGQELASNANLTEIVKLLAELYDEGTKEVKVLKARENQSKEIKNLPVSALFIGSQDNLLFNEEIKRKFKVEFTSKLARRSFFIFVHEDMEEEQFSSIEEMIQREKEIEDTSVQKRQEVSAFIEELTNDLLKFPNKTLTVTDEVRDLFLLYKKYNEELAHTMDNQHPIARLTRAHLQWKAFKLSGALALMECSTQIELEHYKAAIEFCEMINDDVAVFEKELTKEPYELFTDYCRMYSINGEYVIDLHNLRKLGFIPMKGQTATTLKELVKLANSYDKDGIYSCKENEVTYKKLQKSDSILVSYLVSEGTKEYRAAHCASGYTCDEGLQFSDLHDMLLGNYAYSPFRFRNGVRGNDNIDSKCKWIVLDIDSSEITDEEAHLLICDINHFIVRTSNKNNPNKYRVLIELDAEVDVPNHKWINFIQCIANDLGFTADKLPKSQIFFSYTDRQILSIVNGSPLNTKQYLNMLTEHKDVKLSKNNCKEQLNDPMTTFERAYNAPDGEGRRRLIWACKLARELGADREYCKNLLDSITTYWVKGFPERDLDTMKRQLDRWEF